MASEKKNLIKTRKDAKGKINIFYPVISFHDFR